MYKEMLCSHRLRLHLTEMGGCMVGCSARRMGTPRDDLSVPCTCLLKNRMNGLLWTLPGIYCRASRRSHVGVLFHGSMGEAQALITNNSGL